MKNPQESENSHEAHQSLNSFIRQYWQCVPIRHFIWNDLLLYLFKFKDAEYEVQEEKVEEWMQRFLSKLNVNSERINADYHVKFLKALIAILEKNAFPAPEGAYESIGVYVTEPASSSKECQYRRFSLPSSIIHDVCIWSLEDVASISSGTTGLRTWGASLCLLEYLCAEKASPIAQNTILELGSGCGVLGMMLALLGSPMVTLSDTHPLVLERLQQNLTLNQSTLYNLQKNVHLQRLDWTDISVMQKIRTTMLVGADIVYDPSIIPTLVNVIQYAFETCPALVCYIACTIRNEKTFDLFLSSLSASNMQYQVQDISNYRVWFYYEEKDISIKCVEIRR